MAYRIFLDTNIVLDFLDESRPGYEHAAELFQLLEKTNLKGFVSESVINVSSYIAKKKITTGYFITFIKYILDFIKILPCSNQTILLAYHHAKNDLEDAVLYQIAIDNKMNYFITSDKKDLKKLEQAVLPVFNAQEIIALLNV